MKLGNYLVKDVLSESKYMQFFKKTNSRKDGLLLMHLSFVELCLAIASSLK